MGNENWNRHKMLRYTALSHAHTPYGCYIIHIVYEYYCHCHREQTEKCSKALHLLSPMWAAKKFDDLLAFFRGFAIWFHCMAFCRSRRRPPVGLFHPFFHNFKRRIYPPPCSLLIFLWFSPGSVIHIRLIPHNTRTHAYGSFTQCTQSKKIKDARNMANE